MSGVFSSGDGENDALLPALAINWGADVVFVELSDLCCAHIVYCGVMDYLFSDGL